jgi:competence protein ComEA
MKNKFYSIFLLCFMMLFTACKDYDKALTIPVAEDGERAVTEALSDSESSTGAGNRSVADAVGSGNGSSADDSSDQTVSYVYVYVCGAVKQAGLVALPEGSRIADALEAAGGYAEDAKWDVVNLAEIVQDGQMIRFPSLDEVVYPETDGDPRIDINSADVDTLTSLTGIGKSRAQGIISYREKEGPFSSIEDIKNVPGIKDSIFEQIKEEIVVR